MAGAWRLLPPGVVKRCRRTTGGHPKRRCQNAAVVELDRRRHVWRPADRGGPEERPSWWAYCEEHMYGRWIEDGQVYEWRLVPTG
jgi:hypothetical protein